MAWRTEYEQMEFIKDNYNLHKEVIKYFDKTVGYLYVAIHKTTNERYYVVNESDDKAKSDLFMRLPSSSLREGMKFLDDNGDLWTVKWDVSEKVQLMKDNYLYVDNIATYREELMIYTYKGFGSMTFDYRLHDKSGERFSSNKVPKEYESVVNDVVDACIKEQKEPGALLKKPVFWKQFVKSKAAE
jgi:hypothetical protein